MSDNRTFDQIEADRTAFWGGADWFRVAYIHGGVIGGTIYDDRDAGALILNECPVCLALVREPARDDHAAWHANRT